MRPEEVAAVGDLAAEVIGGVTDRVRDVHSGIARRVFWALGARGHAGPDRPRRDRRDRLPGGPEHRRRRCARRGAGRQCDAAARRTVDREPARRTPGGGRAQRRLRRRSRTPRQSPVGADDAAPLRPAGGARGGGARAGLSGRDAAAGGLPPRPGRDGGRLEPRGGPRGALRPSAAVRARLHAAVRALQQRPPDLRERPRPRPAAGAGASRVADRGERDRPDRPRHGRAGRPQRLLRRHGFAVDAARSARLRAGQPPLRHAVRRARGGRARHPVFCPAPTTTSFPLRSAEAPTRPWAACSATCSSAARAPGPRPSPAIGSGSRSPITFTSGEPTTSTCSTTWPSATSWSAG